MPNLAAHSFTSFDTAHGRCSIAWSDVGIAGLLLPTTQDDDIRRWHGRRVPKARPNDPEAGIRTVIADAVRYFEGQPVDFSGVAIDLGEQNDFFLRIYEALRKVGYGRTTTYGGLAGALGAGPEMARAVGTAMATNPTPLIVPCHRVLAAGGRISGFSAPGGSTSKLRMLELEGVRITRPEERKPQRATQASFDF